MAISESEAIEIMQLYKLRLQGSVGDLSSDIEAFDKAIKALEEVERYKKVIEEFYARVDYDCGIKGLDDSDYCSGLIHAKRILERRLEEVSR